MPIDIVLRLCWTAVLEALNMMPISGKIINGARIIPNSMRGSRAISLISLTTILFKPLSKTYDLRENLFKIGGIISGFELCR